MGLTRLFRFRISSRSAQWIHKAGFGSSGISWFRSFLAHGWAFFVSLRNWNQLPTLKAVATGHTLEAPPIKTPISGMRFFYHVAVFRPVLIEHSSGTRHPEDGKAVVESMGFGGLNIFESCPELFGCNYKVHKANKWMLDDGGKSSVGLFGVQRPPRQILVVQPAASLKRFEVCVSA